MTESPYQLLPPLSDEQRHLLRQSIEKNGVLEPVVFDEDGEILDGHHRVEIAEELGIEYPRRVVDDLDEAGKQQYALTVNVARRQLSQSERGSLVARLRSQGMSIRKIAEATGLPKSTVSDDIRQLSESGQLDQPERITGADGRERPASRPAAVPDEARQAVKDVTPEDHPETGEGRSAGLTSALSGADESDASVVGDVAADELPAGPDPVALVNAALEQFVPDPGREAREWGQQLYERLEPINKFTLWFNPEQAAEFADQDDIETLRLLAHSFAEFYRKTLAARDANVVPLRRVQ